LLHSLPGFEKKQNWFRINIKDVFNVAALLRDLHETDSSV